MPALIGSRRALLSSSVLSPRLIPDVAFWIDASQIAGADGDPVSSWADLIGGNHAVQATGTKQPTLKTGILNGRSVVRFDGGDGLVTPAVDMASATGVTVFAVFSAASGGFHMIVETGAVFSANATGFVVLRASNNKLESGFLNDLATSVLADSSEFISTTAMSTVSRFDKTQAAGAEVDLWVSGIAGETVVNGGASDSGGSFGSNILNIGSRNNVASNPLTGDIAELFIVRRAMPDVEILNYDRNYLKPKWGVA